MSVQHLIAAITFWADHWNADPKPFIWTAEAKDIMEKVRRGRAALQNTHTNSVADH
jgi:hypothetical protein